MKKLVVIGGHRGRGPPVAYYRPVHRQSRNHKRPRRMGAGRRARRPGRRASGRWYFRWRTAAAVAVAASGPMTVEVGTVTRATIPAGTDRRRQPDRRDHGLGGAARSRTAAGRGRPTRRPGRRGQRIAKIEDFELVEQIKQQEAAQEVSQATIRQREADLALAKSRTSIGQSLFERKLIAEAGARR